MNTAAFETAKTIPLRMTEMRTLVGKAHYYKEKDEGLYDALCRSASVLLVSHIEGFLNDLVSSICIDLNYFVNDFALMPESIKRYFVYKLSFFEGVPSKDIDKRVRVLMEFFEENSVPVNFGLVAAGEQSGRNPSVKSIDKYFEPIGINKIVSSLHTDFYQRAFEGSTSATYRLLRECKANRSRVFSWPYSGFPEGEFKMPPRKGDPYAGSSLWVTFIEEILKRRHKIAHGSTMENNESSVSLERDIAKAEAMMTGLMLFACGQIGLKYR